MGEKKRGVTVVRISAGEGTERRKLPKDFLSFTIDTSLLIGGFWWGSKKGTKKGVADERTNPIDLENKRLRSYARALAPAMLRIGGTEADRIRFEFGKKAAAAILAGSPMKEKPGPEEGQPAERQETDHDFGMSRRIWKDLHEFVRHIGCSLLFTVGAGPADRDEEGNWTEDNARKVVAYSVRKGYPVAAWEFGNEVNAYPFIYGVSERVSGSRYSDDFARFANLVRSIDPDAKVIGPASAVWPRIGEPNPLLRSLCASAAARFLDAASWHYYPQQSSYGRIAVRRASATKMLNPRNLDEVRRWNGKVNVSVGKAAERREGSQAVENWVTETANALYGGETGISDTFVSTLWWLDELGIFARDGVSKVFRQSLVGARYGLLDQDSMDPRPDYFASFLWKRLMGSVPLTVRQTGTRNPKIRLYAHENGRGSVCTLLAVNLDRKRTCSMAAEGEGGNFAGYSPEDRYVLQGDGSFASRSVLVNGVRAADDLVFDWESRHVKGKYRVRAREYAPDGIIALPPLSAAFVTYRKEVGGKKSGT